MIVEQDRVIEAGEADFRSQVVEASHAHPVIAEFYAKWCEPCARLGPPLEAAVRHAGADITLVKIDIDQSSALADQLFVTAIPALFVFQGGKPIAAEAGVIGAHQVQALVFDALGGAAPRDLRALAAAKMDEGDYDVAARAYAMLRFADPTDDAALAGVARAYMGAGELYRAKAALDLTESADPALEGARAAHAFLDDSPSSLGPLEKALAAAPDDGGAILAYAQGLAGFTRYEEAADLLLARLESAKGRNDEAARALLLKVFLAAGAVSDLAKRGRARLSAIAPV